MMIPSCRCWIRNERPTREVDLEGNVCSFYIEYFSEDGQEWSPLWKYCPYCGAHSSSFFNLRS